MLFWNPYNGIFSAHNALPIVQSFADPTPFCRAEGMIDTIRLMSLVPVHYL